MAQSYDPGVPLMGLYANDCIAYYKHTCTPMFNVALVTIVKKWNQLMCPLMEEMGNQNVMHSPSVISFSHKGKNIIINLPNMSVF